MFSPIGIPVLMTAKFAVHNVVVPIKLGAIPTMPSRVTNALVLTTKHLYSDLEAQTGALAFHEEGYETKSFFNKSECNISG
jgi:hypothetical protein